MQMIVIPLMLSLSSFNSKTMLYKIFFFFFCCVAAGILQLRSIFECSAISGDAFWRIEELELFIQLYLACC
uniref:Putative ovule protein n=1 Tax=Solanum chacoense TaxID=4108 RepID=A0A0V0GY07_SOLCH